MDSSAPLRVLVVDDEPLASARITASLSDTEEIEVVGVANSGEQAVKWIQRHAPDIVFLDIQMPGMTGFDVIREVGAKNMPVIIFVTAYDQYAVRAFELAAVDYLLKPFEDDRLEEALQRAKSWLTFKQSSERETRLVQALEMLGANAPEVSTRNPATGFIDRIAVDSRSHLRVVLVQQIDYITASGVYAEIHVGDKQYIIRESMQSLEERLDPSRFLRIHRSIIVQLDRIDVLMRQTGGDYTIRLKDGTQLSVSRYRIEELEKWMGIRPQP